MAHRVPYKGAIFPPTTKLLVAFSMTHWKSADPPIVINPGFYPHVLFAVKVNFINRRPINFCSLRQHNNQFHSRHLDPCLHRVRSHSSQPPQHANSPLNAKLAFSALNGTPQIDRRFLHISEYINRSNATTPNQCSRIQFVNLRPNQTIGLESLATMTFTKLLSLGWRTHFLLLWFTLYIFFFRLKILFLETFHYIYLH